MVDFSAVRGGTAYDSDGSKVGSVDEIYTDKDTGEPSFVTVHTGLFGSKTTFVPLADASVDGEDLRLPYDKAKIKDAPGVEPDADITDEEQDRLYDYYGLGGGTSGGQGGGYDATDAGTVTGGGAPLTDRDRDGNRGVDELRDGDRDRDGHREGGLLDRDGDGNRGVDELRDGDRDVPRGGTDNDEFVDRERERGGQVGRDTSGPTTDDAMTRSEERLNVGTRREEVGRARMRKYVTTERVSEEVPVSREEVRVTREPITDANAGDAYDGPGISEEEHEVTLHGERAVADKETVPVERVRMDTETVRGTETVEDEIRKEQIEVDDGTGTTGDRGDRDRDGGRGIDVDGDGDADLGTGRRGDRV